MSDRKGAKLPHIHPRGTIPCIKKQVLALDVDVVYPTIKFCNEKMPLKKVHQQLLRKVSVKMLYSQNFVVIL
jgi:hypothetical protein